jgi:hypothetical protein
MAWWIFQNVVITSAFVAVIAMVCRTGRIGPVARHALWVLVLPYKCYCQPNYLIA